MDKASAIQEQVREAVTGGVPLAIQGAASKPWVPAGANQAVLSVQAHSGIVAYDPSELVITARAGTTLLELDAVLAESGQMLSAECPQFNPGSTLGGALATGWSGSRAPYMGSLRDAVLGCRIVNGLGELLEFGGQVMKNVAGYDISRLLTGSLGRLGVILDVSLKVLPRPQREVTLVFQREHQAARELVAQIRQAGEPLSAASFHAGEVYLRFSGSETSLQRLSLQLGGKFAESSYWQALRRFELPFFEAGPASLWRVVRPQQGEPGENALFDWGGGLCWYRGTDNVRDTMDSIGGSQLVHLPTGPVQSQEPVLVTLQQRVAAAFDPHGVFNTGVAATAVV